MILIACALTACSLRYSPLPAGSSSSSASASSQPSLSSASSEEPYIDPTSSPSAPESSDSFEPSEPSDASPEDSGDQSVASSEEPSQESDSLEESSKPSEDSIEESSEPSELSSEEESESSSEQPSQTSDSSEESSSSSTSLPPVYDEPADSLVGIDTSDLSELYETFNTPITNYTSTIKGYFNTTGLHDYYLNYQKNYPQNNVNLFMNEATYRYPSDDIYLSVLNAGKLNRNNNLYSFSLQGDSVEERLATKVTEGDLSLEKENTRYQDGQFTLEDLNEAYFTSFGFTRISSNKYQYARIYDSSIDNQVFNPFIDLCAPGLINTGFYMTFSRVTIELNPKEGVDLRLRLYAATTQWGKLIPEHHDTKYPNWNLLFSEAEISDIGNTKIEPLSDLLGA